MSETTVCELISLMALEGFSRQNNDLVAPILKTIVIDPRALTVHLFLTRFRGSLSDCIEYGHVSKMNLSNIARQLSYLVRSMHEIGLVHLDIKTCNVLVGDHDILVLADFGMTRLLGKDGTLDLKGREVMTITHRTPELLLGHETAGAWSDMWAVALVLY